MVLERLVTRAFNWKMYSIGSFLLPKMPATTIIIMMRLTMMPVGIKTFLDKITSLSSLIIIIL